MKAIGGILMALFLACATMASASYVLASDVTEDMLRESQEDLDAYRLARWYLHHQKPLPLAVDVRRNFTVFYRYMHREAYEIHVHFVERLVMARWLKAKAYARHRVKLW